MALPDHSIFELRGVSQPTVRGTAREAVSALHDLDLRVEAGECTWICGPTDEGKEAVFRILSLEQLPTEGDVLVHGSEMRVLSPGVREDYRRRQFGFVSGTPFLLLKFSAIENLAIPLLKITPVLPEEAKRRIARLLEFAGLLGEAELPAEELSLCQQWKLTVARALAHEPRALFVEDLETALTACEAVEIINLLRRAAADFGVAVIVLCHAPVAALRGDRHLRFASGRLLHDGAPVGVALS